MPGFYLTIEDVRNELQDREPADNSIDCDLAFTDEEIKTAMHAAARDYNMLTPIGVDTVCGDALPYQDTNIFLDGTIIRAYKAACHKLMRNVQTWSTGETTIEFQKTRLQLYKATIQEMFPDWKDAAKERKATRNRALVWSSF